MIKFYLSNSQDFIDSVKSNIISLTHSSWDDWFRYNTTYKISYYDTDGLSTYLGTIKIGQFNMANEQRKPDLPDSFDSLDEIYFSIGQDVSFYEKLNSFGVDFRDEILNSLNDLAFKKELYAKAIEENVTKISLLRSVSQVSVQGEYRRLVTGDSQLTPYKFSFHLPKHSRSQGTDMTLEFNVVPESNPPTNINVIIGRNGVGKTHLFNNMISSLIDSEHEKNNTKGGYFRNSLDKSSDLFSNLISVSFSAFDETNPMQEKRDKTKHLNYSYIGLKRIEKGREKLPPKSPIVLKNEFVKSVLMCKLQGKKDRWISALKMLETDPIFKEAEVSQISEINNEEDFKKLGGKIFNKLSSGHKIVLLTITRLVEAIEEKSLVLLDEPEAYLHPPLLSAFIRALSDILIKRNAVAIIGTHSPVVLQEVPSSCVWKLRRHGATAIAERLEIESFGENVGQLTQEVFGLEVTDAGFHNLLKKIAKSTKTYDLAITKLQNQLGQEGKAILRTLIKHND